jgi:hypothetical protein
MCQARCYLSLPFPFLTWPSLPGHPLAAEPSPKRVGRAPYLLPAFVPTRSSTVSHLLNKDRLRSRRVTAAVSGLLCTPNPVRVPVGTSPPHTHPPIPPAHLRLCQPEGQRCAICWLEPVCGGGGFAAAVSSSLANRVPVGTPIPETVPPKPARACILPLPVCLQGQQGTCWCHADVPDSSHQVSFPAGLVVGTPLVLGLSQPWPPGGRVAPSAG